MMKLRIFSITALAAGALLIQPPVATAQGQGTAAAPDYAQSVRCAFVEIGNFLREDRLHDETGDEAHDRAARASLALNQRFMDHASSLSGKAEDEVIDDMGEIAGPLVQQMQASGQPAAALREQLTECAGLAASIPGAPAGE